MTLQLLNGADRIYPGVSVNANASILVLNQTIDQDNIVASWQIRDQYGQMLLSGNIDTLEVNGIMINLFSLIQIPDNLPATYSGEKYFLIWTVSWENFQTQSSEEIIVFEQEAVEYGLENTVNLTGFDIKIKGIIKSDSDSSVVIKVYDPTNVYLSSVTVSPSNSYPQRLEFEDVYRTNTFWRFINGTDDVIVHDPIDRTELNSDVGQYRLVAGGDWQMYDIHMSQNLSLLETLDPYTLVWTQDDKLIGTSQSWIINNIVANAMHEMQASMERALRYPGLLQSALTDADMLMFLKMGRDYFNVLNYVTNFTMMGADGFMRRAWLICAEYEAASSRQLEEAIKAFDYSGQSTSLTVDVAAAYENYKSELQTRIEDVVKPFKKQLAIKNSREGDGSSATLMRGRAPVITSMTYSRVGSAAEYCIGSNYTKYLRPYGNFT